MDQLIKQTTDRSIKQSINQSNENAFQSNAGPVQTVYTDIPFAPVTMSLM